MAVSVLDGIPAVRVLGPDFAVDGASLPGTVDPGPHAHSRDSVWKELDLRNRTRRLRLSSLLTISALCASLSIPAALFAAEPATVTTTTTTTCSETHWPASVQGAPATLKAGARAGDYIWHNSSGWHLRATHVGHAKVIFTGRIVSNTPMTVAPYRLEKSDRLTLSADKLTLTYRFANYGYIDGFDFRTACAHKLVFRGAMNGVKLPTSRIWIGHDGRHPLQNPFAVLRTR